MFECKAFEVLKTKEFTGVNDCFQDKSNEAVGHYGQTLIILLLPFYLSLENKNHYPVPDTPVHNKNGTPILSAFYKCW